MSLIRCKSRERRLFVFPLEPSGRENQAQYLEFLNNETENQGFYSGLQKFGKNVYAVVWIK